MNSGENDLPPQASDPGVAGNLCPGCGKRLASHFVFCPHCGAPLSGETPGGASSGPNRTTATSPKVGGANNPASNLANNLLSRPAAVSPPIPISPFPGNEGVVELDEVTFEELIVCWRCDLNNPADTRDCIHCEASLKVAGKKKKGAKKSSLPSPSRKPGHLPSPGGIPARPPAVPPPFPSQTAKAGEGSFRPVDDSVRKEPPSTAAMPAPSEQRPPAGPLPFQAPSRQNLIDEIDVLDDSEIAILPEGDALESGSTSKALISGRSTQVGPARDSSFKATVYSRKSSKPGKTKSEAQRNSKSHILFPVLVGYGLMMAVSIAMYAIAIFTYWMKIDLPTWASRLVSASGQFLDTLVVLWLVFHCKLENFGGGRKVFAWVSAMPALAALYSGNIIISDWVGRMLGYDDLDHKASSPADATPINFHEIVTHSIQPGVIEELFCRHLLQGSLQKLTGPHTAIWVAAAMFALLHLYNPLGVPYLFLCGLVLGYYRYWSGSLVLPMTMHALHNFAVMLGGHFR